MIVGLIIGAIVGGAAGYAAKPKVDQEGAMKLASLAANTKDVAAMQNVAYYLKERGYEGYATALSNQAARLLTTGA